MVDRPQQISSQTEKPASSAALLKRVAVTYVRPYTKRILLALLLMAVSAGMTATFANLVQPILDDLLVAEKTSLIVPFSAAVFACFFIRGIATYFHTVIMNLTGQSIVADIQKDLFSRFVGLDMAFFHENPSGTLTARVISDVDVVRGSVTNGFTGFGKSFLTLVFLIGVMFYRDAKLTVMTMTALPLAGLFVTWVGKRLRKISGRIQEQIGGLTSTLSEIFLGIRQVKAYGMEDFERERAGVIINRLRDHVIKGQEVSNLSTPFNETLIGIVMTALIVYGSNQVSTGHLTPGGLMSFIAAFSLAYEPMKRLAKLNNTIQMGMGAAARIFDMLDREAEIRDAADAVELDVKKPSITFTDVTFRYRNELDPVLDHVSFTAESGQVTALVGPSGGGKSTVLNLILRFYDIESGRIDIGGNDISHVTIKSLRGAMALVSQDITIFDDTVAANIAYGLKDIDRADIEKAAKAAAAHDFISALPDGYDTRLGEGGSSLSGGQRQRIALARAILRDAPILLLDEATSALDTESENAIRKSLQQFRKGRTVLVIAHRLSTVKDADKIMVFEKGHIVQQGPHDKLIADNKGLYARLYSSGLQDE